MVPPGFWPLRRLSLRSQRLPVALDWRLAHLRHGSTVLGVVLKAVGAAAFASSGYEMVGTDIAETGGHGRGQERRGLGQLVGHVCGVRLQRAECYCDRVSAAHSHKGVDGDRIVCCGQCILCCECAASTNWACRPFGGAGVWSGLVLHLGKEAIEV